MKCLSNPSPYIEMVGTIQQLLIGEPGRENTEDLRTLVQNKYTAITDQTRYYNFVSSLET